MTLKEKNQQFAAALELLLPSSYGGEKAKYYLRRRETAVLNALKGLYSGNKEQFSRDWPDTSRRTWAEVMPAIEQAWCDIYDNPEG